MIVQGMQAPALFTFFFATTAVLLGCVLTAQILLGIRISENNTELRLMQNTVQNWTAVMIREGLVKPSDIIDGPTGPNAAKRK